MILKNILKNIIETVLNTLVIIGSLNLLTIGILNENYILKFSRNYLQYKIICILIGIAGLILSCAIGNVEHLTASEILDTLDEDEDEVEHLTASEILELVK